MAISVNINASTVGTSIMNAADPSAVSWIRVNADNTITYRTAAQTLSDLGAETALTFSTGLTRTVNTITIDSTVVTLTGAQALSNKTGNISQWTNDSGYLTSAVTAVTGSGNIASSGGATPNLTFTGVLPTANGGTAVNIASAALVLGTASTTAGQLTLSNATNAFTQTLRGTNPAASITYDLPTTAPTLGQVLSATAPAAGVVTLSWATASGGITIGGTAITSGTDYRVLFQDATASDFVTQLANFTMGSVASGFLDVPTGYALGGHTLISEQASKALRVGNTANADIQSTAIGYGANASSGSGNSTAIGSEARAGMAAVAVGRSATATGMTALAIGLVATASHTSSAAIGLYATTTANNQLVLGGDGTVSGLSSVGYSTVYIGNGVTNASPTSVSIQPTGGLGSNVAGASLTKASGKATGTAAGGNNVEQTSVKGSSGTTLQSLTDRHNIVGKYVDITGGAATTFGQLALSTSSTNAGGEVLYTIHASDGTDTQSLTGVLKYDIVNKAGTLTVVYSDVQNGTGACSSGTLTATVTASASGTNILFQANAVSSLVETVLRVSFQVVNNFGVATITAA